MTWIPCAVRLPELVHHTIGQGITTDRLFSDDVITARIVDGKLVWVDWARLGMKNEDDWGKVPAGVLFWADDDDLIAMHSDRDSPTHWMPMPALPKESE